MSTLQYLEASPTKQRVKRKLCLPDERTQISELQFSPPVTDLDKNLHSFTKRQKLSYFAITVPYENVTAELQTLSSTIQDLKKLVRENEQMRVFNLVVELGEWIIKAQPKKMQNEPFNSVTNLASALKKLGHKNMTKVGVDKKYFKYLDRLNEMRAPRNGLVHDTAPLFATFLMQPENDKKRQFWGPVFELVDEKSIEELATEATKPNILDDAVDGDL